ncbi:MAG TPA: penicillin-binding transpeptidase domain-containing protein [Actinomycetes bacterium]|nr:penicillin-binding transpeptidase domain-containing protein [Actinomycetes bacterium]
MRRWMVVAVVVVLLAAGGGGAWLLLRPRGEPGPVAAAYLDAFGRRDWAAMRALVAAPPADFAAQHARALQDLRATAASFTAEPPRTDGGRAEVPFQARLQLRALGEWSYQGLLRMVRHDRRWRVDWSPAAIHPDLAAGLRLQRVRSWPERAPILARDGTVLAGPGPTVEVQIVGERVKDPAEVAAALRQHAGVTAAQARAALAEAERRPNQRVPVAVLPQDRYEAVRDAIYPVPGLSFQDKTGRKAGGPASARALVGTVEPVTADDLKRLGAPYQAGDLTGHGNGLEASFERQLAGSPSGEVRLAGQDGTAAKVLHRFPGKEGRPVRTTLDPRAQRAGERALKGVGKPAALVAVRPSTGELLAVVNAPAEYNRALLGRYPPGSTFKVVTAAALLDGGLRPGDRVNCPKETSVGGRRFGNFEDEVLGRVPFSSAFAHSCNTAFVGLAARRLDGEELGAAAGRFGFGVEPAPGIPAVTSRVPPPADQADLGAEGFGQGRITASPLQMAMVAATVAEGQWHSPRLVDGQDGTGDGGQAPGALDRGVADTLRRLMRLVVTEGTARSAGLPAGVAGKTGTAEFGSGDPLPTHAWFIGFRGDLAFAVVVEDGGVGGRVAAPLAGRFLGAL